MSISKTGAILAVALTLASAAPAFAHKEGTEWLAMMDRLRQQRASWQAAPSVNTPVLNASGAGSKAAISHKRSKTRAQP